MSCVCCISAHFQSFTGFNPLDLISCSCYILWGFEVCLILIHVNYGSQAGSWLLPSQFSSVQSLSHVWLFVTPWTAACQDSLSITNYRSLLKLSQWCYPTISSTVIPFCSCLHISQRQHLFKQFSSSHQVAKVLEFQLQHQSFQWIFRTDFL